MFAGASLCTPALAQPRDQRDERYDRRPPPPPGPPGIQPPRGPVVVIAPPAPDPRIVIVRVQSLEDQRRREREIRIHDEREWEASREARAAIHQREVMEQWHSAAIRADARPELELHAERMAHLNRILDIAVGDRDPVLAGRCRIVMQREVARNIRVMASFESIGGAP